MAMSFAMAGLRIPGVTILDPGCVAKTYPGFWDDLDSPADRIPRNASPLILDQDLMHPISMCSGMIVKNVNAGHGHYFPMSEGVHNVWTPSRSRRVAPWTSSRSGGHAARGWRSPQGSMEDNFHAEPSRFPDQVAVGFGAMAFVVGIVIADELLGVMSKVDVEGKKITVIEKGTDKEIEIKITDDTESGERKAEFAKVNLEKLDTGREEGHRCRQERR